MEKKRIRLDFELKFENLTNSNPSFAAGKVAIAYAGRNRNRSSISKDVFEKALPSLANCPLVGNFDVEAQDFGGHDISVLVDEAGDMKIENATIPFGVIPETMDAHWETVTESDGTEHEYLCCNVILWKRQAGYECLAAGGVWNQSMEINVNQYMIDHDGYCVIEDMTYEAFCILGRSVEPCFESASIQIATPAAVSEYSTQFKLMLDELRSYSSKTNRKTEGGENNLNEDIVNQILEKYNLAKEDIDFEITDEMTEEIFESKISEIAASKTNAVQDANGVGNEQTFSATYNQKREALRNALVPEVRRDGTGKILNEVYFYLVDFDDTYVFVERDEWNENGDLNETYCRCAYEFDETNRTAALTGEFEPMILQWLTKEENAKLEQSRSAFEMLSKEFDEYRADHSYCNDDYSALKQFREDVMNAERESKIHEVLDRFSDLSENEEFKDLIARAHDFEDIADLEKECFVIKGKIAMNFSKPAKKPSSVKVTVSAPESVPGELYGGLFERFGKH